MEAAVEVGVHGIIDVRHFGRTVAARYLQETKAYTLHRLAAPLVRLK